MCERFFLETHHHHYHKIEFLPERHCNDNNKHIYNSIYNIIREPQTRMVERFLPSNSYRNVKTSYFFKKAVRIKNKSQNNFLILIDKH